MPAKNISDNQMPNKQLSSNQVLVDLIQQTKLGDEQAFQDLYNLTNKRLYRYLTRFLGELSTVDKLMSATYVEIWSKLDVYDESVRVNIWILGIARKLAYEELQDPEIRARKIKQLSQSQQANSDAFVTQKKLITAMQSLSPQHREILGLVLMPNTRYQEISELLKIPVSNVRMKVFQAKEALKKRLAKIEIN